IDPNRVYMRSLATRRANKSISGSIKGAIEVCKTAGFDLIIVETSGIGQGDSGIIDITDIPIYVMTSEYGAATQLEKINMLDLAEFVVLNKFEKKGSLDALRAVRKQIKRNRGEWDKDMADMPVYPTIAAQFHDEGVNRLFKALVDSINKRYSFEWEPKQYTNAEPAEDIQTQAIIPGKRQRYLSEISETVRDYHHWTKEQVRVAKKLNQVEGTLERIDHWLLMSRRALRISSVQCKTIGSVSSIRAAAIFWTTGMSYTKNTSKIMWTYRFGIRPLKMKCSVNH